MLEDIAIRVGGVYTHNAGETTATDAQPRVGDWGSVRITA